MTPALAHLPDPAPEITPEQRTALTMLFEAHAEKDALLRPFLIASAERQLVFLAELQGLPREERGQAA